MAGFYARLERAGYSYDWFFQACESAFRELSNTVALDGSASALTHDRFYTVVLELMPGYEPTTELDGKRIRREDGRCCCRPSIQCQIGVSEKNNGVWGLAVVFRLKNDDFPIDHSHLSF